MKMLKMIKDLFYMPRSIMGEPSRQTLIYIKKLVEEIKIIKFKSGTKAFDWTVPNEWSIKDAFIKDMAGKKVLDFKKNLLSVVYYSMPINQWISKKDLLGTQAIISSMTKAERENPSIINGSRRARIAKGSGRNISDVNRLIKQFNQIKVFMKKTKNMDLGKFPFKI